MKFALFRLDLAKHGEMSGGLGFLLLLLALGVHSAGEDEQLGMPTSSKLGLDDIVAASVLAGLLAGVLALAAAVAIAGKFSASFFCNLLQRGLFGGTSFLLLGRWLRPVPAFCFRERPAMVDKKKKKNN
jgi:hypothetical protein